MKRAYDLFVRDILECIADIQSFTKDMDILSFRADKKTQFAVLRCLEMIGEAVSKIPDDVKEQHPGIPWRKIRNLRNVVTHQYWEVEPEMVWNIIQTFLTKLECDIKVLLNEIDPTK